MLLLGSFHSVVRFSTVVVKRVAAMVVGLAVLAGFGFVGFAIADLFELEEVELVQKLT